MLSVAGNSTLPSGIRGCPKGACARALHACCAHVTILEREIAELESAEGVELSLLANCSAQTIAKLVVVD